MKRFVGVTLFTLFLLATLLIIQQPESIVKAEDLSDNHTSEEIALKGNLRTNIVPYSGVGSGWTIHVRPGMRFGSNDRVIGYADFLIPVYFTDKSLLFVNPKVSWDNRESYEFNIGAGYRHMLLNDKLILGGNIYYDWRRSSSGEKYHQLGVGLEAMTEFGITALNARINGYISLSDEETINTWREYYFTSMALAYTTAYTIEEPLSGLDYELGLRIPGISNYVETWAYVGGYNYFADRSKDINGFMARLEILPTSFIRASYEFRYDNVRNDEHYGEVTVEIPFSIENAIAGKNPFEGLDSRMFNGSRDMKTRMYDMVRRDVDIVLETTDITRKTHLDDVLPGDSDYMGMVYVDNSKNVPGAGSGTLEDPYGDIDDAFGDVTATRKTIFVFKGNSNYGDNYVIGAVPTGFNLWGEGYDMYGMGGFAGHPIVSNFLDVAANTNNVTIMGLGLNNGIDLSDPVSITHNDLTLSHLLVSGAASGNYQTLGDRATLHNFTIDSCIFDGGNVANRILLHSNRTSYTGTFTFTNNEAKRFSGSSMISLDHGSSGHGGSWAHTDTMIFANNYIHDCIGGSIALRGYAGPGPNYDFVNDFANFTDKVYVYGNRFVNIGVGGTTSSWAAIEVNNAKELYFYNNYVDNVDMGIWGEGQAGQFWFIGKAEIYSNTFKNNYEGLYFVDVQPWWGGVYGPWDVSGIRVYNNNITGNTMYGIKNDVGNLGGKLNAQNNWWGNPGGPGVGGANIIDNATTIDASSPSGSPF